MQTRERAELIRDDKTRPDPGPLCIRAGFVPDSINDEDRTVGIVFSTGAAVRRWRWTQDFGIEEYDQALSLSPSAHRSEFLNSGRAPYLEAHNAYDLDAVLGVIVAGSVEFDEEGGEARARVRFDETELAERRFGSVKRGILRNVSVGFNIHANEETRAPDSDREIVRELTAIDWESLEISQVPIGADSGATVREARAYVGRFNKTSEGEQVKDNEKNQKADLSAEQRAEAIAEGIAEGAKIESERQTGIRLTARTLGFNVESDELPKTLLADSGTTLDGARAQMIEAAAARDDKQATSSARSDVTVGAEEGEKRGGAMVRALMHRAFPGAKKADGSESFPVESGTVEGEFAHRSLLWLAEDCLQRAGVDTRFMSRSRIASEAMGLRTARGPSSVRAPGMISTSDFPLLLADVAGKSLRQGYEMTPRTFVPWARQVSLADLKDVKRIQLSGGGALAEVVEGDDYTYARTHEGREVYRLRKFGRIIAITEETLINDDLDGFTRVAQIYGAAGADIESDEVYGVLGNNPAMADGVDLYDGAHSNIALANLTAPTIASLGEGRLIMKSHTDLDGTRPLQITPKFLVHPAALDTVVDQMLTTINATTATTVIPGYVRGLVPISEIRLDGFSATAWHLIADYNRIDTVEYAYLAGEEGLQIATRNGWETDGIEIKAKMRFAAKAIDHRGMFRNVGV